MPEIGTSLAAMHRPNEGEHMLHLPMQSELRKHTAPQEPETLTGRSHQVTLTPYIPVVLGPDTMTKTPIAAISNTARKTAIGPPFSIMIACCPCYKRVSAARQYKAPNTNGAAPEKTSSQRRSASAFARGDLSLPLPSAGRDKSVHRTRAAFQVTE